MSDIDNEAAVFVVSCYEHARVVRIDDHVLTAKQLLPNVKGGFMFGDVISLYIHTISTNMRTHTMY